MRSPEEVLENTIRRCRERDIIIPTYREMVDPALVPEGIRAELGDIGLWDLNPRNLFRITWKNEPVETGGGFGGVNFIELPSELTGVDARIFMLVGKFFPTGAHKVGATFGPLVEKLVRGAFDPTTQKALWPSTGNYCRGGAYDAALLACPSIAVLPEGMSSERFEWLEKIGSEIFATPGSESNVKEIYDKVKELKAERGDEIVVLNQFAEFGNAVWHYVCTGRAMEEVFEAERGEDSRLAGVCLTQGSAGTLGCAEYLREVHPRLKVVAAEALPVPDSPVQRLRRPPHRRHRRQTRAVDPQHQEHGRGDGNRRRGLHAAAEALQRARRAVPTSRNRESTRSWWVVSSCSASHPSPIC